MESKKTVLINVAYLLELPEEELKDENGLLDKLTNQICSDKKLEVEQGEYELSWNTTTSLTLDSESLNCGKCSKCGQWTTDRDKKEAIKGLTNGASVDGKLLCDECLPSSHRWAF